MNKTGFAVSVIALLLLAGSALAQDSNVVAACTKTVDSEGCTIEECPGGTVTKSCPTAEQPVPVTCTAYVDSAGCTVTECTDGTKDVSCPTECKMYVDEAGCTVEVCINGYEDKYCPTTRTCTKYVDSRGCTVEECSDGTINRSCPAVEVTCKTYTDSAGCTVKECSDGSRGVYCPEVRCDKYVDASGCTVQRCTDGKETKECPTCPSYEAVSAMEADCIKAGLNAAIGADSMGCKTIKCVAGCSVSEAEINERITKCKMAGMAYSIYTDYAGCRQVECMSMPTPTQPTVTSATVSCTEAYNPNTGFTEKVCKTPCREITSEEKYKCMNAGGKPVANTDSQGCIYLKCVFPEATQPDILTQQCMSADEITRIEKDCAARGLSIARETTMGGCTIIKCVAKAPEQTCPAYGTEAVSELKEVCSREGGRVVEEFDERGCSRLGCKPAKESCAEIPDKVVRKCEEQGGKFVAKKDEYGCAVYAECVERGKQTGTVEIEEIPDATKLLSLAMKLEGIRIEFDKLARKASSIAEYYNSVGDSANAGKFERVAGMIQSVIANLDELKLKIRNNAENMNEETLISIKSDLKYIREVMIKDILYVMLSSYEETAEGILNCGQDEQCFLEAIRICRKAVLTGFAGGNSAKVEIAGLEDGKCVFTITFIINGAAKSMTCKDPEYAFLTPTPQKMEEICTGELLFYMSNFTAAAPRAITVERPVRTETTEQIPVEVPEPSSGGEQSSEPLQPVNEVQIPAETEPIEPIPAGG